MTFRFLASFHYFQRVDLAHIAGSYDGPVEVLADSGAFSAATIGATIRLPDYVAWLRDWQGLITTAATLDVIGDPTATRRNTLTLERQGFQVLPVFHVGTPWGELEQLCARYRYLALGGMVPHKMKPDQVMRWLIRCFQIARDHGTVFHGFGQTRDKTCRDLPFYTVDSSAWAAGARYGRMRLWDHRRARIVDVQTGNPTMARRHAAVLRAHGADPALVARHGFGLRSGKTDAEYERENLMIRQTPALAYHRLGEWLTSRHNVPAPPGWTSTGTGMFLAEAQPPHLLMAAEAISGDVRKATR